MEINITDFFNNAHPADYSASVAERGENANTETWNAACNADFMLLDNQEKLSAVKEHFKSFGAWDEDEIANWSPNEINALFIQLISGDMREANLDGKATKNEWDDYENDENQSHNLFLADEQVFYYVGN